MDEDIELQLPIEVSSASVSGLQLQKNVQHHSQWALKLDIMALVIIATKIRSCQKIHEP
jgi:hypothetical protein